MKQFSSFRDPSGAVFVREGVVLRQINECYRPQYEKLMGSGLYERLVKEGLLVAHEETGEAPEEGAAYKVVRPEQIPFISYPYEWSFGQYKDAALCTLRAHRAALDFDMILKDASAYNIQFLRGKPVLIDTLSFDFYHEGDPWVAYGQFCRHFLAPLFLMAHVDVRLSQLMRVYIDGLPIDLAAKLLGRKGGFAARQHIKWQARSIDKHAEDGKKKEELKRVEIKRFNYVALIDSLIRTVEALSLKDIVTEWGDYYAHTNYSDDAAKAKEQLVSSFLDEVKPQTAWDLGANDARYSRLALKYGGSVVAFDIDPVAVERSYHAASAAGENLLPLLLDLTNPSPAIGFANKERESIDQRQCPDCILMLAVIHHLAISNNLPLAKIAQWLSGVTGHLIIEFVPKQDSQVQTLLATRDDIFPDYTQEGFERAFSQFFAIARSERVAGSERTLYLMKAKDE